MGAMGILQVIDDSVYLCVCRVYSNVYRKWIIFDDIYDNIDA